MITNLLFLVLNFTSIPQQNCLSISGVITASGSTKNGSHSIYGSSNVTISENGSSLLFSDICAGYLNVMYPGESIEMTLTINCNSVIPKSRSTNFGDLEVTGGSWNESSRILSIDWRIPFNEIVERSEFLIN